MKHKSYVINGETYCQTELGAGRAALVMPFIFDGMAAGEGRAEFLSSLMRHASAIMTIVLLDEGMTELDWVRANKAPGWLDGRAEFLSTVATYPEALEVLNDFLACNPIGLWLEIAGTVVGTFMGILAAPPQTSSVSAPSAPGATPPDETTF